MDSSVWNVVKQAWPMIAGMKSPLTILDGVWPVVKESISDFSQGAINVA
jgi:hypothetical protein